MKIPLTIAVLAFGAAVNAQATIIFSTGNQQYNNVNFAAAVTAPTVTGQANINGVDYDVLFSNMIGPDGSTQVDIHAQHGVAFLQSAHDATTDPHTGFVSLIMTPQAGFAFTAGDFKLDYLSNQLPGTVTFQGIDQLGNLTTSTFNITAAGQDPYQFTTADGELVTSIKFSVPQSQQNKLEDIKQVSVNMAPIPEPTTALFGLALVGFCTTARRRNKVTA